MATKAPMTPEEQLAKAKLRALAQGVQVWVLETEPTPRYAVPSSSMASMFFARNARNAAEAT